MIPDLITTSGRESMSTVERIRMLSNEIILLEANAPVFGHVRHASSGAEVHELANLLGLLKNVIVLYEALGTTSTLSTCECMVLAWRRGGYAETMRIRNLRRSAAKP